jgi:glycosyltransferase involved in cell wall biosynthesis
MNRDAEQRPGRQVTNDRDQLIEILKRLENCADLVQEELSEYRNTDAGLLDRDRGSKTNKLSIVVPVYNELPTIARVVCRVAALPLHKEIIIVDDHSTDGTRELLKQLVDVPDLKIILQPYNNGKGAALKKGFEHVTGDFVVVQDADLEYDPRDIPKLIQPLLSGAADVVYGSRFLGSEIQDRSWVHRMGNGLLTSASNLLNGTKLTDMETCYKAFCKDVLGDIDIQQNRFGIEPELTAKLARRGFRIVEVPISYCSRGYDEGKKIGIRDLFNAFYCIGRYGISD